jgi:hypothetical protein
MHIERLSFLKNGGDSVRSSDKNLSMNRRFGDEICLNIGSLLAAVKNLNC